MEFAKWETKDNMINNIPLNKVNRESEVTCSGIPILYDDEYLYVDSKSAHSIVIGSTGSGKTQTITLPMLEMAAMAGENVLVQDNMGELYEHTKDMFIEKGYKIVKLDFNNTTESTKWNPFDLPYKMYKDGNMDRAMDLIDDLAYYLLVDEHDLHVVDDFWINSVVSYFTGLVLYSFENNKNVTFNTLYELDNEIRKDSKSFLDSLDENGKAYMNLKSTLLAPTDTKGSIFALFEQKFRRYILRSNLLEMLSSSEYDISDFSKEKTIIYTTSSLVEGTRHLLSLVVNQIYDLININGIENKVSIILDDFTNLVPVKNFDKMLGNSRTLGIMFTLMVKSLKDLKLVYGNEVAYSIRNNCGNIVYLLSPDTETLEEISQYCGIADIIDGHEIPLVTVEELRTFKIFEAVVLVPRMYPFRTKLLPYYAIKNKNVV